ncbi:hypothetical protein BV22DRAFT_1027657 [Leucogyrophana mollusca]|uniref:Uncharacterized protein n=1 Tax=Leucogyrophana mollusca TaxID=85980 RepID=A0ACB8C0B7_9AGAM|nr:hypothetical protein BV22DRAFT_1027657 [Leucogyrophana mollusca]
MEKRVNVVLALFLATKVQRSTWGDDAQITPTRLTGDAIIGYDDASRPTRHNCSGLGYTKSTKGKDIIILTSDQSGRYGATSAAP